MKKYNVISIISEISTENIQKQIIATYDSIDDATIFLEQIYMKNKFNSEIKDIFFDGKTLSMFNSSANCYSNYKISESDVAG